MRVLLACIALLVVLINTAQAQLTEQSEGTGVVDSTGAGTVPILTFSQGECTPWPGTSKRCADDADCDDYCVDVDDPVDCCTGAGAGTCTCEERRAEAFYTAPVVGPFYGRLTLDGTVQQLFGGTYTPAFSCALWLDPEDPGPFCYGPSTLETDCDNGVQVPWSNTVTPPDRRDASSIHVTGATGQILNIECGG